MPLEFKYDKIIELFEKYWIIGTQKPAALHHFTGIDQGCPHDHPYGFWTTILSGGYMEQVFEVYKDKSNDRFLARKPGDRFFVPATRIHKIIELFEGECLTYVEPQPTERKSGDWKFEAGIFFKHWDEKEFLPYKEHPAFK